MTDRDGVKIGITCDKCSHEYQVGVAGVDLETFTYACPNCGYETGFSKDEITEITTAHGIAEKKAIKMADDMLKKSFRGFKKK